MRKTKGRKRASTKECFDTDGSTKLKVLFIMVVSAAVFFYFAFSSYDNTLKAIILLGDLVLTGTIVRQLTGWEGYYGLLIVRGKRGFGLMAWFAKRFEPALRELMDFGMSLGFGILYSHLLFKDKPKKFIIHSLLVVAFFAWTYFQFIQVIGGAMGSLVFLLSLLLGLFALGYSFLIISSFNILSYYYSKFILNVVPAGPAPAAGAMPVIPGITIPFWEGIIAIIIVASVHELAHGVMCNIVKLRIKSSGALLFGFLPIGAFVEPDEEKFKN
ncbi:hypothetical protein HY991_02440, partial [Candidatus Micrarchaeota archaeon]|nr:hypothetical protein [Candidatus Micrarchaeota archaeon]